MKLQSQPLKHFQRDGRTVAGLFGVKSLQLCGQELLSLLPSRGQESEPIAKIARAHVAQPAEANAACASRH